MESVLLEVANFAIDNYFDLRDLPHELQSLTENRVSLILEVPKNPVLASALISFRHLMVLSRVIQKVIRENRDRDVDFEAIFYLMSYYSATQLNLDLIEMFQRFSNPLDESEKLASETMKKKLDQLFSQVIQSLEKKKQIDF